MKEDALIVNAQTIEHELSKLWEQTAQAYSGREQKAVMRACVLNLMVCAPGWVQEAELSQIMAEIATQHPSRVFVILTEPTADDSSLDARVAVQCYASTGDRNQICCEQILIRALGQRIHQLPSLIRPLLVPDLPVFLWWRNTLNFEQSPFGELVESSDRVIIDSDSFPNPGEGIQKLCAWIQGRARWAAFTDLSWSRLTPWRALISGFFDLDEYRSYLRQLNRIEIDCIAQSPEEGSIPVQALLAAAWLATRLDWKPVSKPQWIHGHTCQLALRAEKGPVIVHIKVSSIDGNSPSQVTSMRLLVERDPPVQFGISVSRDASHLEASVTFEQRNPIGRIIRFEKDEEAVLIRKELEILRHDNVYEEVLAFLAGLSPPGA